MRPLLLTVTSPASSPVPPAPPSVSRPSVATIARGQDRVRREHESAVAAAAADRLREDAVRLVAFGVDHANRWSTVTSPAMRALAALAAEGQVDHRHLAAHARRRGSR